MSTYNFVNIPKIDIEPLLHTQNEKEMQEVASKIHDACRGLGFFYITNHGIDVVHLQKMVNMFFAIMTEEEKFNIAVNAYNASNHHTHTGYYLPVADKKPAERFLYSNPNFTANTPLVLQKLREMNIWPAGNKYAEFRNFCEDYYWKMFNLSSKLLQGFAVSLNKRQDFFEKYFNSSDTLSTISFIRRPLVSNPPEMQSTKEGIKIDFGEHHDVSLISIAFQTPIPNVQLLVGDKYFDVPVSDEYLLVHCGSYMSYITYDYYPAIKHRIRFVNADRLCLPFFADLGYHSEIEPFFPKAEMEVKERRPGLLYGDYLREERRALLRKNGQI